MATYPGGIPSLTRPTSGDPANDGSATDAVVIVDALSDEVEAIAGELGVNPSGSEATVAARLTAAESATATHLSDTSDAHDASAISVDASGFNGNLTTSDDTVQKVAQKLDDLAAGGLSAEDVRDTIGTALVGGTGITVTPNDGADAITVATSAVLPTVVDAKGDLLVGTAADTVGRLAVGTDGHVLTADSAAASGVKWAAAAGGGSPLDVRAQGVSLTTAATQLDFVGGGVVTTEPSADQVAVTIPGLAPKTTPGAYKYHFPMMYGSVSSFGTYQRLYFLKFKAGGNDFNGAAVYVDTAAASGVVRLGAFTFNGINTMTRVVDWGTLSAAGTGEVPLVFSSDWAPTLGATYYIGVCIQVTSTVKLRGGYVLPDGQTNDADSAAWPPVGAYYAGNVTGALSSTYSVSAALVSDQAPWVQLSTT